MASRSATRCAAGLLGAVLALAPAWVEAAGAQAGQSLSPSPLAFGAVETGATSAAGTLTFSSASQVTVDGVSVTGPFAAVGGSCGAGVVVGPRAPCTVSVVFRPSAVGPQSGAVTVAYAGDSSLQAALSGTGVAPPTTVPPTTGTTLPPSTETTGPPATTTPTTRPVATTARGSTSTTRVAVTAPGETTTTEATTDTTPVTLPAEPLPTLPPPSPDLSRLPTLEATARGGARSGPAGIGITVLGANYPARGGRAVALRLISSRPVAQAAPDCSTVYFFLDGRRVGSSRPDAGGNVRRNGLSVPGDTRPGAHTVTSSCRSSGRPIMASAPFDVVDASVHRTALATSLPRAADVSFDPGDLLLSALAVAGLLVLIAFPAELFNTTLEEHYDEVRGWFRLKPRPIGGGRHHGALLAAFLVLSGPLWFAMQPSSAFDAATAMGALGLSLATGIVVLAADLPAARHVRRRYQERARPIVIPGSLIMAVACVALSRAVHFQPGYFYGLVGGLALGRSLARDETGRLAARSAAGLLALSVVAWLVLQPVAAASRATGTSLGSVMVENVLGGVFWAALDTLVIALLPLRLLEGAKVVGWSRKAWAVLYALTLLAFVHILLRPGTGYVSDTSVSPPNVVIGMFVGFAVFSFAFWGWFRFRKEPERPPLPAIRATPGPGSADG